ncbi:MAG: apolipoprotein N-acyltransferase [Hyphomicrobiaceae bacterium]
MSALRPLPPLARLSPWSRRAVAAVGGATSVLAMAPFFFWPILFVTLPLLVALIDHAVATAPRRAPARAAATAWFFGFGYFLAGLFWIGEAFLVEAEKFAALMPFAVTAMPAGLALFWAAAAAAASLVWRPGLQRVLVLALALSAAEWLRGHVLTGFPWNVLGYALTAPDALMQSASVLGIYGLTLLAVVVFAAPLVAYADASAVPDRAPNSAYRKALPSALASLATIVALWAWGTLRLAGPHPVDQTVRIRLVQPSIPQREKWQPANQRRIFERHLDLSRRNAAGEIDDAKGIDLIVWPEAAMPFLPLDTPAALQAIGRVVPSGAHLVAGFLRVEPSPLRAGRRRILNSLAAFASDGRPVAIYDKTHLVPFGEYLPFQQTLEAIGLEQLTRIRGGFDVGPTPRPLLRVAGLPAFAPLICYEAIFPATVVQSAERPAGLLNLTNDGWFGNTTGPRQHLHQARVRAVEEGLPLIRSANNGISAVIDAEGRVAAALDLDVAGVVDARLPGRLPLTVYARFGDAIFLGLWLAILAVVALRRPRLTRRARPST